MQGSSVTPVVSVIIPAFNAAATIREAVSSALAQTIAEVEVIVVDDGSSDATRAIVTALMAKDRRVVALHHDLTRGVSAARNTAIDAAPGAWIAVLDADDWFMPERLATLIGSAERRGLDVIIDNLIRIDATSGEPLGLAFPPEWMTPEEPVDLSFLLRHDFPGGHPFGLGYCKPIFRAVVLRDLVGGYKEGLHCAEDVLALQTAMYAGARVGTAPDALYLYRHGSMSLSFRIGAYPTISRVNKMIREIDRSHGGRMAQLLEARQIELDYDGLIKSIKQRKWAEFGYFLYNTRKARLLHGLKIAALKRLGLRRDRGMDRTPIPSLPAAR